MHTTTSPAPLRLGAPPASKVLCRILMCRRPSQLALQPFHRRSKFCPVPLLHCLSGLLELRSRLLQSWLPGGGRRLGGGRLRRSLQGFLRTEKVVERLVERGLHHNLVSRNRDDALQLRKVRAFGR